MTPEQREEIYNNCVKLGNSNIVARQIATNSISQWDNHIKTREHSISCLFNWIVSPEGADYWREEYRSCDDDIQPKDVQDGLTNSDIQSLLSILKTSFKDATIAKSIYKGYAASAWEKSVKGTPDGEFNFINFSYYKASQEYFKNQEKKIATLIAKLKDMR